MKIAIVGTSSVLTENEERDVRQMISHVLDGFTNEITVITGGAEGVDKMAEEIAKGKGLTVIVYLPDKNNWKGYRKRNLQIAKDCDELFCITIPVKKVTCYHHSPLQNHEKTAGCWTLSKVLLMNKPCRLLVTPKR